MLTTIVSILIVGLVLWLVYYLVSLFMPGVPQQIVGIILGISLLVYSLKELRIFNIPWLN